MKKTNFNSLLDGYRDHLTEMLSRIEDNDREVEKRAKALRIIPSKTVWLYLDTRDQVIGWSERKEAYKPMGRDGAWREFSEVFK